MCNPFALFAQTSLISYLQDQWKKKKQTKEQAAAARRAKLDPDSTNAKSAKEVMDERARKRKLEELEDEDESDIDGVEKELPKQGLKQTQEKKPKKQKLLDSAEKSKVSTEVSAENSAAEQKRQPKKEKKKELKAKRMEDKAAKQTTTTTIAATSTKKKTSFTENITEDAEDIAMAYEELSGEEMRHFDIEGLEEGPHEETVSPSHRG